MQTYPCETACAPAKEEKKYYTAEQVRNSEAGKVFKITNWGLKDAVPYLIVVSSARTGTPATILYYNSTNGSLEAAKSALGDYKYELLPNAKLLMSIKEN